MKKLIEEIIKPLLEDTKIKKIVGVYGGRFQPFGPHHKKVYQWLDKQFDDAYITTSNIKKLPRHPMNFKEKVRHMSKMGIPSSKIIMEKTPFVAKSLQSKFDPETTAFVYIFGAKDTGRLGSGKYFQDFKKNKNNLKGFEEHGYYLVAPHMSVSAGGMEVSGTSMRELLGSEKYKENREKLFKKMFGYYDKGLFQMMTNKFSKIFESLDEDDSLEFEPKVMIYKKSKWRKKHNDPKYYDNKETELLQDINLQFQNGYPSQKAFEEWWKEYAFTFSKNRNLKTYRAEVLNKLKSLKEAFKIPLSIGDTVLMGKFKNKKVVVKAIGINDKGDLTINGKSASKFRLVKKPNIVPKNESLFSKEWWKENLLLEGGAYGHMAHPFDDKDLTFGDLKKIITDGLGGQLNREDGVTEKLDGQNLMISWKKDKLIIARNKGHIKNFGKTALSVSGIKSKFEGRGNIADAFGFAVTDLSKAISGLSKKQKDKIFNEGQHWMNLEVMWPASANVIDYDVAEIVFHGALKYDKSGNPRGEVKGSGRILAGMIKQRNQNIQKKYSIGKPNFLTVSKHQDFSKVKDKFLGKLQKLQNEFGLKESDTLALYHQMWWESFITSQKQTNFFYEKPSRYKILKGLVKRWAFFDKSYTIPMIKNDLENYPPLLEWVLKFDKQNHQIQVKKNMKPFETLFFEVGAEILKNISGYIAANPDKAVQGIKKRIDKAISDVRSGGDLKKLNKLKLQLDKLNTIGGLTAIVPSEGIVFKYKGKTYKFTGAFAPVNQITGLISF